MIVLYIIIFILLVIFSAFFSSAETSLLSLDKIKLNLKAKKRKKKAVLLKDILKDPEEFFSTILIGNNFVNIAAASISTVLFTRLITARVELVLLISTVATTIIILLFAEIIPKSYAFRYSEKLSYFYAYPIRFFNYLFYPFVKTASFMSNLLFKKGSTPLEKRDFTIEEIKHFLSSEIKLFRHHPEALRMVNEILDTAEKDVKSIMTPRTNIVALEETADMDALMKIIVEKNLSKVPIFRKTLDNITGIVHAGKLIPALMANQLKNLSLPAIAAKPIFISEYSSLNYVLKEFKKQVLNMAVVLDEYGSTIGILTLNDIFREILGEIEIGYRPIRQIRENQFLVKGSVPVEEINTKLNIQLPEKKDYTTLSGMFIYHFGKFPHEGSDLTVGDIQLTVKRMGKRKIDEILMILDNK